MTYSIVARDPATGMLGVAAQSHFFAVGSIATFAEPGVGTIASQAFASRQYGPLGLELLRAGAGAADVLDALLRLDPRRAIRQVGVVDATGVAAGFTGDGCVVHAGHATGPGFSVQGNMLAGGAVWGAMADAYQAADGDLAGRLLAALDAAEAAGGDARGRQSANLLIVDGRRSATPWHSVLFDVRVDDHPEPLAELRRLVDLRRSYQRIGNVLFEDGPLFDDPAGVDPLALEAVLADLGELEAAIGAEQVEPGLWRNVLLARNGRADEAARGLAGLVARQPKLSTFLAGLSEAGFVPAGLPALVADAAAPVAAGR